MTRSWLATRAVRSARAGRTATGCASMGDEVKVAKKSDAALRWAILDVAMKLVEHDLTHGREGLFKTPRGGMDWFAELAESLSGVEEG